MTDRAANKRKWLWLVCLTAFCCSRVTGAEAHRLFAHVVTIPERGDVTGYVLYVQDTKFSFVPPVNWSVKYDPTRKAATIVPPDLDVGISFVTVFENAGSKPELNAQRLREKLLERYPGAMITEQFKCYASGKEGLAFDFERVMDEEVRVAFRVAFVAFDDGIIEFEMKTSHDRFSKYHHAFGNLLNSFRIGP